jgi:hypothetical protein
MDEETATPSITTNIYAVALGGLLIFSSYQIAKLGYDWSVEGVKYLRDKKNEKK